MPTVLKIGPYRFYFWSRENNEPPHIHVARDRLEAKYWLDPLVELSWNKGYPRQELTRLYRLVLSHREQLLEAWNDHFRQA